MKLIEKKVSSAQLLNDRGNAGTDGQEENILHSGLVRTPREPVIMDDFQIFIRFICKWWKFNSIQIGSRRAGAVPLLALY